MALSPWAASRRAPSTHIRFRCERGRVSITTHRPAGGASGAGGVSTANNRPPGAATTNGRSARARASSAGVSLHGIEPPRGLVHERRTLPSGVLDEGPARHLTHHGGADLHPARFQVGDERRGARAQPGAVLDLDDAGAAGPRRERLAEVLLARAVDDATVEVVAVHVDGAVAPEPLHELVDGGAGALTLGDLREQHAAELLAEIVDRPVRRLPERERAARGIAARRARGHQRAEAHAEPRRALAAREPASLGR